MKFEKGNKAAKGGRRNPPDGRPTKEQQEIKEEAAQIAREFIDAHVQDFLDSYLKLGKGKALDPATVRHAIDKILPDEQMEATRPLIVTFLKFGNDSHPAENVVTTYHRPAEELPAPIVSNGNGDEAGRQGALPTLKFINFSNSEKRRK
jgi:hypothetical protein